MMMFSLGLVLGLVIGCCVALIIFACMAAVADHDATMEEHAQMINRRLSMTSDALGPLPWPDYWPPGIRRD